MSSESNHWGNRGAQSGNTNPDHYKRQGASDSQANEAAAAAARARAAQGKN